MSFTPAPYTPFELSPDELTAAVLRYASNPLYLDNDDWENADNPYRRQLRPQVVPHLDFSRVLPREELLSYQGLATQRILTTIYEADLVFLPQAGLAEKWEDFRRFYNPTNRVLGEIIRPALERQVFGFLDDEVEVAGAWTRDSLVEFLRNIDNRDRQTPSLAEAAIEKSVDPQRAARMWLIQFAPDFLSEASPMIRNVLGNYGPVQSEWFKIIVDEYGYGVHSTKHSTLFENTLRSVGLETDLHHYWQYYLNSSLLMNNYFHYLGKNHELLFRYLGALYYTETTLVDFCERAAGLLTRVFGDSVDVRYFTEHVHIDTHHGRMALEKLILPLVDTYGETVIPEIVRGFEEFQVVADIADRDFAAQIEWMDDRPRYLALHDPVWEAIQSGRVTAPVAHLVEPRGELSNTHCHDGDELCHIVSGTMRFESGFDSTQILRAGEGTVIRRNRLHGANIESAECVYEIHSIGDHQACLS
ncbi:iron-containing redox enzyme family protein [Micromonospora cathayae]|uniref:Iron-containing redox enzyme family protein n=1 Tax=Micromonospora cathayae TaxID=3028804 RepID=A0ABY7ZNB2_9ACTN|nr:iron-containing redox enzyme family protein [Micromonospora sp. HUAS 3]WDZ83712.1 iron-containing redox enzyme family protein [Micromonospora sp. HUAS 3]